MNKLLIALFTISFAGAAAADTDQYRFAYTTADFSDAASVESLHERITRTARDYCPGYLPSKNIAETRRCVEEVTDKIVQSINAPALSAMANGNADQVRIALEQQRHSHSTRG
jgi:UrcA family protein